MFPTKEAIYVGIIVAVLSATWFISNSLYDKFILLPQRQIVKLNQDVKDRDLAINNLGVEIVQLAEQNKVTGFEEFWKGYQDENITDISNDYIF